MARMTKEEMAKLMATQLPEDVRDEYAEKVAMVLGDVQPSIETYRQPKRYQNRSKY